MENEHLGESGQTDMLCVSLSSTDYLTHRFGTQAKETEDCYLRLDKELEAFFSMLDKKIGKGAWTVFLSADHGAMQTPEYLKDLKVPSGVLSGIATYNELNEKLFAKFRVKQLLKAYFEYQFYFDEEKLDSAHISRAEAEDFVLDILQKKQEVLFAFSYRNFDKLIAPAFLKERLQNGYYAKRSGDIQMILRSNFTETQWKGTDHGTGYPYDLHIPLLWYGWGIKPGKTNREVYMTDVAPTIAAMLHIQMPSGSVGKVLGEVIKP
jgi:predicted AlkP superfamily pyrophosphatase or phosphodiesterase